MAWRIYPGELNTGEIAKKDNWWGLGGAVGKSFEQWQGFQNDPESQVGGWAKAVFKTQYIAMYLGYGT